MRCFRFVHGRPPLVCELLPTVSRRESLGFSEHGKQGVSVVVRFCDDTVYEHKGTINFVDVSVDKMADTVTVRATLPNPDGLLIDSQLVRVNVDFGKPQETIIIPQSALIADQQGIYVFAVEEGRT